MAKEEKINDIEKRKKELQDELKRIQKELDHSIDEVRVDVSSKLDPKTLIKKYPLSSVGVSLLLGFLAGKGSGRGESSSRPRSRSDGNKLGSMIWDELKSSATKKAIRVLFNYIDDILEPIEGSESDKPSQNGTRSLSDL